MKDLDTCLVTTWESFSARWNSVNFDIRSRSDEQVERERWLIPGVIPFSRWVLFPAAVMIQLCCGSLYAWSGFNSPIETALYGPNGLVDRGMAVNTFYIAVAVFGNGPFRGAILGASMFFFGNLLTALGVHFKQISIIYIGYGLFAGAGLGVAYISPVSPLQKWFPEIRGLAAGAAVCGFGGGSIIAPYTQKALIGPDFAKLGDAGKNLGVPLTFVILGSVYFVIMATCALALRMPPPGYSVKGITIETIRGAESESFKTSTAPTSTPLANDTSTTTLNTLAARVDDSLTPSIPKDIEDPSPSALTSLFSMTLWESLTSLEYALMYTMFFGRPNYGSPDHLQDPTNRCDTDGEDNLAGTRKAFFCASLAVQGIMLGFLPTIIWNQSYWAFLFAVNVIAFFYGAGFGMIPAFLADQFGSRNVGATHGVILTAWSIAGVCGGLTFTSRKFHVYDINFKWILVFVVVGFFLACLVPTHLRERRLPLVEGEKARWMRFRVGKKGRMGES
ncbi:major facilitator superfamily domain-containing protein [Chytridium lagenaria]|nr:major facilitator superfamily domain-containing protein [Chytridium lagenaria]